MNIRKLSSPMLDELVNMKMGNSDTPQNFQNHVHHVHKFIYKLLVFSSR